MSKQSLIERVDAYAPDKGAACFDAMREEFRQVCSDPVALEVLERKLRQNDFDAVKRLLKVVAEGVPKLSKRRRFVMLPIIGVLAIYTLVVALAQLSQYVVHYEGICRDICRSANMDYDRTAGGPGAGSSLPAPSGCVCSVLSNAAARPAAGGCVESEEASAAIPGTKLRCDGHWLFALTSWWFGAGCLGLWGLVIFVDRWLLR